MPINADKPHLWKQDIAASVDQFNAWFRKFAPKAYRESRQETTKSVEKAMRLSRDWQDLRFHQRKRRKEEATKAHQLRTKYGPQVEFILFLCGYFDTPHLGYEAAEGIDWIWEHRIEDLDHLGL